ncbi:hypothetical protein PRZ48_000835 [Zasmidium cellare]|uniref:Uncharacterized protein n=1 Tax=Zasmidium cellare TaxID=395010 RepID=A0ABR0F140_ZASCE|nr:hypothetical protein PRZ48_000835 [Zasmidium cellare]
MLPPVDPEILSANPQFDALYRDLCSNKLEEDGTTKIDAKAQKERDAFKEELRKARVSAAKQNLVKSYLSALSYRGDDLPSELQELVGIIAASLSARLSKEDMNLLRDDVEKFKENIALIALVVSHAAAEDITGIARLLQQDKPLDWRDLPSRLQGLQEETSQTRSAINSTRLSLIQQSSTIHTLYRQALELSIRTLEQTIHGSVSRYTKAKAEYLATVAKAMNAKTQVQLNQLLAQTQSEEMQGALKSKVEELEREEKGLRRKVREREEVLEEYRGQGGGIEGLAREYAEVLREAERVRGDVERLEGRVS